ncbi:hypothetical protein SAMN02745134_00332 [Clostridium acidisoli DSM 12555]|uniref:Uncharacterized protein n=1 Tax=Clostridium acidisoli DSM 12555 TaxID=1121291 RepID=A0A1W1X0T3_9CLOT|nr:hypothetical protein [Clostridium acidisoli]SMC17453.1 hypothetical protein SAMN02745134_00332 [Clostridium acidisoli DSM 12555]
MEKKNLFKRIEQHKIITSIIIFIVIIVIFILCIVVIQLPYAIGKYHSFVIINFHASDLLTFLGSYLGLAGTIFLGLITIWQNKKLREESKAKDINRLYSENERIRLQYVPSFLIQGMSSEEQRDIHSENVAKESLWTLINQTNPYTFQFDNKELKWIDSHWVSIRKCFQILNCGNNTAQDVKIIIKINENEYPCVKTFSIDKNSTIYFRVDFDKSTFTLNENTLLLLRFKDTFQNDYEQIFKMYVKDDNIYIENNSKINIVNRWNLTPSLENLKNELMK